MSRTGAGRSDGGFTLLELLVVMALLSIVAVAGAVWVPDIGDRLAVTRGAAHLERELSRVAMDSLRTGYDRTATLVRTAARQSLHVDDHVAELDPTVTVNWTAAAETGSDWRRGMITFFGTGGASGGKLELTRGNIRAVVEIDWLTARVHTVW